ncbi:MAG: OmcA/MtrC family decaheme c-type cytochrome [Halioglobus sp.]
MMMVNTIRNWFIAGSIALLVACGGGGGGGGDRAPGVEPGPTQPGGAVIPPAPVLPAPNPSPYADAEELFAFITAVTIPEDGHAIVDFQLTDGNNTAIIDLEVSNVHFTLAKLQSSDLGNLTGSWQSYVNIIEDPEVGTGTERRLQATFESDGEFSNNLDGSYIYRFATSTTNLPDDILDQAATEDLDLSYQPGLTHRVAIQFDGGQVPVNPWYDWLPSTGATEDIFHMAISATDNCNLCHDQLGMHGGNRIEVQYCVTCHNPGSTDADSTNTVDMKVMIHKLHRGASLPSVEAGGEYAIYGYKNSKHDYSNVHYPQDIRRCENCHAGTATGEGREDLVLTPQGDNWTQYPARASCGSCHDDVDFEQHAGGQPDDSDCASCHSEGGRAGSVEYSHRMLVADAMKDFEAEVISVANSAPGQIPEVTFKVSNPNTGEAYDIFNDPVWTQAASSLNIKVSWDTGDYTNTGNGEDNSSSISSSALADAIDNGDGSYRVSASMAIPDGSAAPGIAASGSGAATVEGHPAVDLEDDGVFVQVPLINARGFFSIDESDGIAVPRRESVELPRCLACHGSLVLHGDNRSDNIDSCVTCHNPRNSDRGVREIAASPPTDGKQEESIDFKTMIHGIHAAGMRENPLQIVGFGGRNTHVYDTTTVHYPGTLSNCLACHTEDENETSFRLPLAPGVLGTSVDTGEDRQDPGDDIVVTPATAVCASCHDDTVAAAHMESNGGSFATTQADIDNGLVVEQCNICHAAGKAYDVSTVHQVD